jgi:hypothetical protein
VVEVGAKAPFADFLFQVAVGGGNDSGRGMPCLGFADALELAVLEHAQQFRLEVERQFADFIEKQRAVGSIFEIAGTRAAGASERPFAVAEQGCFDQAGGNGRTVQGQVGFGCALGQAVQGGSGQFLAAARFAFDQYRKRRAANCLSWARNFCIGALSPIRPSSISADVSLKDNTRR